MKRKALIGLFIMAVALGITMNLGQKSQDTRKKAAENTEGQDLKWTQVKSEIGLNSIGSQSETKLEIMVNYSKNNSPILTLGKMKKYNGKAPKNILGDSKIKLLDENQKVIYEGKFQIPNIRMGEKVEELEKTDFAITVPFLENTKNIVIEDKNGQKIGEKIFGDYETVDNEVDYWTLSMGETAADDAYVDLVFIGDNYKTEQELVDYFDPFMDIISRTVYDVEPFKIRKNQIRIHKIRGNFNLECSFGSSDRCLWCSYSMVEEVVNKAGVPADNVFVLSHNNRYGGCATYGGGIGFGSDLYQRGYEDTDYAGIYKKYEIGDKNGNNANLTAVHEMGHSFGSLDDEYIYGDREYASARSDNCCDVNNNVSVCSGWGGNVGKNDVYQGCTSSKMFRSSQQSIMKNQSYSFFNTVSLNKVNKIIGDVAGFYSPVFNATSMSFSGTIGANNIQLINFSASNLAQIHHFELLVDGKLDKTYYYTDRDYIYGTWNEKYQQTSFSKTPLMILDTRSYNDGNHKVSIRAMDGLNREIGRVEQSVLVDNSKDLGMKPNLSTQIDKYIQSGQSITGGNGLAISSKGLLIPYFDTDNYPGLSFNMLTGDVEAKTIDVNILEKIATDSAKRMVNVSYGIKMPRQYERTGDKVFMAYFRENFETNRYDLILYRCLDYLCKNKGEYVVESGVSKVDNTGVLGSLQIEINKQGNPVISRIYREDENEYLVNKIKMIVCGNDSCTANNTVKILNLTNKLSLGGEISRLFLDADDKPLFVIGGEKSYEYVFVNCKDNLCNSFAEGKKSKVVDVDTATRMLDAVVDKFGNPIVLYYVGKGGHNRLVYLRCSNKLCDGDSFDNEVVVDKTDWVYSFYRGSIVVDKNNIPVIGFSRYDGLWIKKGNDLALVDFEKLEDSTNYVFRIGLDFSNRPVMTYVGTYGKSVNYLHCQTENCKDQATENLSRKCEVDKPGYVGLNRVKGDYNCDGIVNLVDFNIWRNEGIDGEKVFDYWRADGDGDGVSTVADYSTWRKWYLK